MKRVSMGLQTTVLVLLSLLFCGQCLAGHGQESAPQTGILVVAFGTTIPEARAGFDQVDALVKKTFPDIPVYWAYTSKIVRDKVAGEEGKELLSVAESLALMADRGFTHVAILSLHTIPGEEYCSLKETAKAFEGLPDGFEKVAVSHPLLGESGDYPAAVQALLGVLPKDRKPGDAVVLMGHGTHHPADASYAALQYYLWKQDPNLLLGTVEGNPTLDDVLAELGKRKPGRVFVLPFMAVAGDHARNDMAGDEDDSWKSVLTAAGYDVVPVLHGTSEYPAFAQMWVAHLAEAFEQLK